ncbi:MAG: hypothetical protein IKR30_01165 [Bacteroidales bacterium]|jgi:cell fate regulator YaaT (PSP1 superfamily)|nr:hypothetical protein [Bacteroidales bacterium]
MEENIKEKGITTYDCSRGCRIERSPIGELNVDYDKSCCKLEDFNWLEGIPEDSSKNIFEVRFKNTRKLFYRNDSGQLIKEGDLVVVEAQTGHDVGIVTLAGPLVFRQMARRKYNPETYEYKKIYRKAKILDIERWQEAIAREHDTMIRARQIAAGLGLDMKIGDVEFQGDGTKAIFYYIADERVDFRQLIKDFAAEFNIRIEMKQIGARQEAGLIGGLGVCGRPLCCSGHMSDFQSITTQAARCQDLSLNPQKLAGQCSKLKCCINYEASVYIDAQKGMPQLREPLEFKDGKAYLVKTDILRGLMYFSYDKDSLAKIWPLSFEEAAEIAALNRKGIQPDSLQDQDEGSKETDFVSAIGDDSITRFDERRKKRRNNRNRQNRRQKDRGADKGQEKNEN